jgi:hypothetical protein
MDAINLNIRWIFRSGHAGNHASKMTFRYIQFTGAFFLSCNGPGRGRSQAWILVENIGYLFRIN